jgi:indole-3-glycerol phosphate synthase
MEQGSSGVLLLAGVVGADLPSLLDAATLMGAEALVEVHSPNELDFALGCGASLFLVNTRDRFTGIRYPNQVAVFCFAICRSLIAALVY